MVSLIPALVSINDAFFYDERYSDESLERHGFEQDGIALLWKMFDQLSIDIMNFLRSRFPSLGELNHSICCELQMIPLREKIEEIESMYECYRSIIAPCSHLTLESA
jgi:hypothetical protein